MRQIRVSKDLIEAAHMPRNKLSPIGLASLMPDIEYIDVAGHVLIRAVQALSLIHI